MSPTCLAHWDNFLNMRVDYSREKTVKQSFDPLPQDVGGSKQVKDNKSSDGQGIHEHFVCRKATLSTNLTGVFLTAREAFRCMKEHGGKIIVMRLPGGGGGLCKERRLLRIEVWRPRASSRLG